MKVFIKQLLSAIFVTVCMQTTAFAAVGSFVNSEEIEVVSVEQLMSEISLIDTIGKGILLSISQCENDEICLGHVDRTEVQQMIDTINDRVQSLSERRETTGEQGLEDVLIAYVEQRENLNNYLDRINLIVPDDSAEEDLGDDFFGITTTRVPSITEQYSVFNDVDDELDDDIFVPAEEDTDDVEAVEAVEESSTEQSIE